MDDFDLEEFARMFDAALASNNPAVKKALRNFMMVSAIVHAQDGDERIAGPLETLIKKVNHLESMIRELQSNQAYKDNYYKKYYDNNPTWVYQPNTSTSSGTSNTTWYGNDISKVWSDDSSNDEFIKQLIRDVKFK